MRVEFNTEVDRYEAVLAVVRDAYGVEPDVVAQREPPAPDAATPPEAPEPAREWTRDRLAEFAASLAADAAEAVRFIAAGAPAVPLDAAIEHLAAHTGIEGFNGQMMGGRMASVGFTCRRMRMPPPLYLDKRTREYRIDDAVAEVLRDLLGPPARPGQPA